MGRDGRRLTMSELDLRLRGEPEGAPPPPPGYAPKITRVPVDGITSFLGIVMCTAIIVFTPLQCMGMT